MKLTARNTIIWGFIISCVALLVNAIVLSNVTERSQNTESAYTALTQSLNDQTNIKDEGEKKFESYRLNANLAPLLSKEDREYILYDANSLFHDSILYLYSAGNDLSMTEFRRAETEVELEDEKEENRTSDTESGENTSADELLTAKKKPEMDSAEFERAFKNLENVRDESGKVDYKAKHRAITVISNLSTETKDAEQKTVRFTRLNDFLNERYVETYDKKRLKIAQLNELRNYQSSLVNYSIFGSLVLQMLGLIFIFLKDFIQDRQG